MPTTCKKAFVYIGCAVRFLFILGFYLLVTGVIRLRFEEQPAYCLWFDD